MPPPHNNRGWRLIRDAVCREKGQLCVSSGDNPKEDCLGYMKEVQNIDAWLDLVEFGFVYVDRILGKSAGL